jgi:tetratricopeptide (TPR) repeat protein
MSKRLNRFRISLTALFTLTLLSGLAGPLSSAQQPPRSERAARFQEWRVALQQARTLGEAGDRAKAIALYESVLLEADRQSERGLLVARAHDGLADELRKSERCLDALPHYRAAASSWIELFKGPQPRQAVTLHNLGLCQMKLTSWDAAIESLRSATAIWIAANGQESEGLAATQQALAAATQHQSIP